MHNNTSATPLGKVMLHVERGNDKHLLRFFIVNAVVLPILVSSIGMKLIKILDCDNIHSISSTSSQMASTALSDPHQFEDVFNGLGELLGNM